MFVKRNSPKSGLGFTLAEVLITLAIIGIVAVLTVPTLISRYKERAIITSLKKFYATFAQVYAITLVTEGKEFTSKDIEKHLQIVKICEQSTEGCTNKLRKNLKGNSYIPFGANDAWMTNKDYVVLNSGAILRVAREQVCSETGCGEISVDINGDAAPNTLGRDTFHFYITENGVLPMGHREDARTPFSTCSLNPPAASDPNIITGGYGCTAWVLENENMDYLRCDDLSWEGKHRCSD